jgi:hypothetical protein
LAGLSLAHGLGFYFLSGGVKSEERGVEIHKRKVKILLQQKGFKRVAPTFRSGTKSEDVLALATIINWLKDRE